ncbi:hypothetical protein [Hyalangium rubrum]|uniref:Uncharacterized protein n=1 Tax=Hyalangium rubrum TaxID=3103134 RepID=A0ABU5H6G8_9BACT|nr:hypothetical protein [Hyalangium sp. s54d21]MDY7228357.1 hypothetical protein [Hyalangium sp. s54d21]
MDSANVILNTTFPQPANFNITGNGKVGGDMNVGGEMIVDGDLSVTGRVFGGQTVTGYLQPQNWTYSKVSPVTTWWPLWSGQISVARPSLLWLSLNGYWTPGAGECYATILVDEVPLAAPCGTNQGQCWGATYSSGSGERFPLGYTGFVSVAAGTHTLAAAVVPGVGDTCSIIGARIFYAIIPQ